MTTCSEFADLFAQIGETVDQANADILLDVTCTGFNFRVGSDGWALVHMSYEGQPLGSFQLHLDRGAGKAAELLLSDLTAALDIKAQKTAKPIEARGTAKAVVFS